MLPSGPMGRKVAAGAILLTLVAAAAVLAVLLVRIPGGHVAVVSQGGAEEGTWTMEAGLHLRPFGASITLYPTGPVTAAGELIATPASGGEVPLRFTVTFRIAPARAGDLHRTLGGRSLQEYGSARAQELIKEAAARADVAELLTPAFRERSAAAAGASLQRAGLEDATIVLEGAGEDALLAAAQYLGPRREAGRIREAVTEAIARTPSPGWKLLTAAAMVDESDRQLDRAEKGYLDALAAEPTALPPMTQLVNLYGVAGQWRKMARILDATVTADPNSVVHMNWLAMALVKMDQLQGAEEILKKGLAVDPDNATLHSNLGALYMKQNRTEEARAHLTRAVEIAPRSAQALFNLGSALAAVDRMAEALPYLERAEQVGEATPALLRALGAVHEALGNAERSAEYRRRLEQIQAGGAGGRAAPAPPARRG